LDLLLRLLVKCALVFINQGINLRLILRLKKLEL
jgi:hypothetical protein